jgi:folate-binding protein YgfZ
MTWVELDDRDYLVARGADARTFLQGQLTADVRLLTAGRALRAAAANPQGRVSALAELYAVGDDVLLVVPRGEGAYLRGRLARYVLRARVTLTEETVEWRALGAIGAEAMASLEEVFGPRIGDAGSVVRQGDLFAVRVDGTPRVALFGPREAMDRLAAQIPPARESIDRWHLADVRAGLPAVYAQTRELFLPHVLNLDLLGAVSVSKGCYTGQEIVARTHHLGRVKRRMVRVVAALDAPPAGGTAVHARGEVTGHVVRSAPGEASGHELLVTVSLADAAQPLTLATAGSTELVRAPLPYSIPGLDTTEPVD